MSVAIVNRIRARDKATFDSIIDRFTGRSRLVDGMKGFQGIELLVDRDGLEVLVVTRWDSMESLKAWLDSQEFKAAHKKAGPRLDAESEGRIYEVIPL